MKDQPAGTSPEQYYRFCPRCGAPLEVRHVEEQNRLVCTKGDFVFYQNPHTAVAALVYNDHQEVLFVERGEEPMKGAWDVPGGFADYGEDPQTALAREMEEELHVLWKPRRLLGVYHGWYDSRGLAVSVDVVYYQGTIQGTIRPDSDVAGYRWFPLDALPPNIAFANILEAIADARKSA